MNLEQFAELNKSNLKKAMRNRNPNKERFVNNGEIRNDERFSLYIINCWC